MADSAFMPSERAGTRPHSVRLARANADHTGPHGGTEWRTTSYLGVLQPRHALDPLNTNPSINKGRKPKDDLWEAIADRSARSAVSPEMDPSYNLTTSRRTPQEGCGQKA
jgi:hypothetical protein